MNILVNGQSHQFPPETTIAALIARLGIHRRGLAVERNRQVVSRQQYEAVRLQDGDCVEIVTLVGGG